MRNSVKKTTKAEIEFFNNFPGRFVLLFFKGLLIFTTQQKTGFL